MAAAVITSKEHHAHRCSECGHTFSHDGPKKPYKDAEGRIFDWYKRQHDCPRCGHEECYLIVQPSEADMPLPTWRMVDLRWRVLYAMGIKDPTSTQLCAELNLLN